MTRKKDKGHNPPPVMNTLKAEVLSNGSYIPITPNSREPCAFETDFFKGEAMIIVRTAPIDDHYAQFFEGRKRLFEVQVQGKFKRMPIGEVFVGAEASHKLELGLIARSISKAAINLCSTMVGDLHSSLGENKGKELFQLPHLVAPIFITFDKIIETKKDEKLPPLGVPFTEDLEYRKKRLKWRSIKDANVDLETTYSFSVNTSNINLLNWTLVGIPMVRPMDLSTFINDSAIRLVGYEIPDSVLVQCPGEHPMKKLNYVFNMNLKRMVPGDETDDAESSEDDAAGQGNVGGAGGIAVNADTESDEDDDGVEEVEEVVLTTDSATVTTTTIMRKSSGGARVREVGLQDLAGEDTDGEEMGLDEPDDEDELMVGTGPGTGGRRPSKSGEEDGTYLGRRSALLSDDDTADDDGKQRTANKNRGSGGGRSVSTGGTQSGAAQSIGQSQGGIKGVSGWIRKHMSVRGPKDGGVAPGKDGLGGTGEELANLPELEVADVNESGEYSLTDYEMEGTGDMAYCPGCLEMVQDGRRRMLYFLPLPEGHERMAMTTNTDMEVDLDGPRLRPYSEIAKQLPLVPIPRMHKNKRLSSLEKRRRQIVESYRVLSKQQDSTAVSRFVSFLQGTSQADKDFLDGNTSVYQRFANKKGNATLSGTGVGKASAGVSQSSSSLNIAADHPGHHGGGAVTTTSSNSAAVMGGSISSEVEAFEGCVALATSRRHWVEFYLIVNADEVRFYRKHHSANPRAKSHERRAALRIDMNDIISVQPMRFLDIPLQGFSFLQLETFTRMYYLMVRSDIQLHEWIEAFVHFNGKEMLNSPFDESVYTNTSSGANTPSSKFYQSPNDEPFLAKSACWKLDKKRIFNYRRIIFNPAAIPTKYSQLSPNQYIETILANPLFQTNGMGDGGTPSSSVTTACHWVRFMDEISWLQTINVSNMSENERIAFFLNLYHVMVLHGSLVVGPPPGWNYWNAFFNNITYLFSYEIVSMADVDHNILRANMARPSSLSIIPVPFHQFPGLAITCRDFRLNYCVNNGSKTMPSMVPIYSPDYLDELLDEMTALMLMMNVDIDIHKKHVSLPKVSMTDFTPNLTRLKEATSPTSLPGPAGSSDSADATGDYVAGATGAATPLDVLRNLLYYLSKDDRILATRILNENMHVGIRFKNQNLKCRKLRVYNPAAVVSARTRSMSKAGLGDLSDGGRSKSDTDNNTLAEMLSNGDFLVDIYQELVA